MKKRAIFFDRDGVLVKLILNPLTKDYEPPHKKEDLQLLLTPDTVRGLKKLQEHYLFFLVSTQPDYAYGKTTLKAIKEINAKFDRILLSYGIHFKEYYYCYHGRKGKGIVPEYTYNCECRKPNPFFLLKAEKDYDINLKESWMVGDTDTDIDCGNAVGTRTILIEEPSSADKRGRSIPAYKAKSLKDATDIILKAKT